MRRVRFSGLSAGDDVVSERDLAPRAAFVLFVEFVPRTRWGVYGVKFCIKPRNEEVAALIARHPELRRLDIFIDRAALALDDRQALLNEDASKKFDDDALGYIFFCKWMWDGLRQIVIAWEQASVVRISFETLLKGIEVKGKMEEMRRLVREVQMTVDRTAAQLDATGAFDVGETRIYQPGSGGKREVKPASAPPVTLV
jgi:hypothetical protein